MENNISRAESGADKQCGTVNQNENGSSTVSVHAERQISKYERLSKASVVLFIIAGVSLLLYIVMRLSAPFSDFFNTYIASFFRAALAYMTNWYPASVAETMVLLLPLATVAMIFIAVRYYCLSWRSVLTYVLTVISYVSLIFSLFVFTFASGYNGSDIDDKLGLERHDVSAEELYETSLILADCINKELDSIYFCQDGASDMMYTYEEMNDKLLKAYDSLCDDHSFIQRLYSRVKPVLLSEPWSYTHTTGIYTFFTGEANFNNVFPDYTTPFTVAHELAHQRGISREDEANLVAFLVCERSDDPYIRYSGYLNMYQYVASALSRADKDLYREARAELDGRVNGELSAYREFFKKYQDNVVANISNTVNEAGIKFQGSRSYGMVVDLTVAYYKSRENVGD